MALGCCIDATSRSLPQLFPEAEQLSTPREQVPPATPEFAPAIPASPPSIAVKRAALLRL
jgi:hypothetical protein